MASITGLGIASIGMKLLGVGKWLLNLVPKAIGWALENPFQAGCLFLALWMVWVQVKTIPAKNYEIAVQSGAKDILAKRWYAEVLAHNQTIINVELGRRVAAELDRQNRKRVEDELTNKISEVENENTTLRERNRALVNDRLRGAAVRTAQISFSGSGAEELSSIPVLSSGIVSGTSSAIISETDALICADNYTQLTGLIAAWKAAALVDVNGDGP